MRIAIAAWAAALLVAGPVAAADRFDVSAIATGYTYYNRPGATLEQHNADLVDCAKRTGLPGPTKNLGASAYNGGIAFGLVWAGPIAGMYANKVENCMVVRGWRVVRLTDAEGAPLAGLAPADLMTRLEPLVGASTPPGVVVRTWSNLAMQPDSYRITSRPPAPGKGQLSLRVLLEGGIWQQPSTPAAPMMIGPTDPIWPTRPIKLEEIPQAPPGGAIVVVRVTGISLSSGTGVGFMRVLGSPDETPRPERDGPFTMYATIGTLFARKEGNWFVLVLPPGRWRLSSSGFLDYCLGSPSFEVAAGEVVYAGSFALKGDRLGPDLDLAPARTYLSGAGLADRVRAAQYRNGDVGFCGFGVPYSIEFDGAPFNPDYVWGSRASGAN